jgi:hypothetical protein
MSTTAGSSPPSAAGANVAQFRHLFYFSKYQSMMVKAAIIMIRRMKAKKGCCCMNKRPHQGVLAL